MEKAEKLLQLYPPWKEAVSRIALRVDEEGYGLFFPHEELRRLFDLQEPEQANAGVWRKYQFAYLDALENLKEALLTDHNIYLANVRGQGYQVLFPKEQVDLGPRKNIKKIHTLIMQGIKTLVHVQEELLDEEGQQLRLKNMERFAFMQTATRKRKLKGGDAVRQLPGPDKLKK